MRKISPIEIAEIIKSHSKFALFGHVSPDGDCFGAVYSLKIALERIGKKAFLHLSDTPTEFMSFIKDYASFVKEGYQSEVDLVIICDAPEWSRVQNADILEEYEKHGKEILLIDHHQPGNLIEKSDFVWSDITSSSTCEMILHVLKNLNIEIDKIIATLLLTGLETDTSSFQNQNTTKESFEAAAFLVSKGARLGVIINNAFMTRQINVAKIYGLALERIIFNNRYKTVTTYITETDLEKQNVGRESISGIANYLNSIEGAKLIVVIYVKNNGEIEVSLRTRAEKVDVSELAKRLGGGGHKKASGFSLTGKLDIDVLKINNYF